MSNKLENDPRHVARVLAVQFLFTNLIGRRINLELQHFEANSALSLNESKKANLKLYEQIIEGVLEHEAKLDEILQKAAPAWPLDQINPVDLIILRIALWEGMFHKSTPPKVVLNEAIEIAKIFSNLESSKFINGVLGNLII